MAHPFLTDAFPPVTRIPRQEYKSTFSALSWFLLSAAVSLALPTHELWNLLKKN